MSIQPIPPTTGPTTAGQLAARATQNDQALAAWLGELDGRVDSGTHLTGAESIDSLPNGLYIVPTGGVAADLGMPVAHGILLLQRWGAGLSGAGLAVFFTRHEPSRTYTYIWNPDGTPGSGWLLEGLPPYQKERHLTSADSLSDLESGLWIVPTGSVATALGLPEVAHGVLRVERWGASEWGIARFETRDNPSRTWSYAWGSGGVPLGGWVRADSDLAESFARAQAKQPTWLTTFQPGHGWATVSGTGATPTADTTDYLIGSQSLKFDPAADQADTFSSPHLNIDLRGKGIVVWAKIDAESGASTTGLRVAAGDLAGGNYAQWDIIRPRATAPHARLGEWVQVRLAQQTIIGTGPDWTNIQQIQVGSPNTSAARTWHLQAIGAFPLDTRYPNGVITLTFDDGEDEMIEVARRSLTPRGMAGVCFAPREKVGQPGYVTEDDLRELHHVHGWTIGAHGWYDYTTYTPEELRAEWAGDRGWMVGLGLPAPRHMAYMGGNVNDQVIRVAQEFFTTGRTIASGLEPYPPGDPYRLRGVTAISDAPGAATTPALAKAWIDRSVASGQWLSLVFHRVVDTPLSTSDISWAAFDDLMDYIAASGAAVRTTAEMFPGTDIHAGGGTSVTDNGNGTATLDEAAGIGGAG